MRHCKQIVAIAAVILFGGATVFADAPTPILLDDQPGINAPMVGDPADDSTWNYSPIDWGQSGHRQGDGSLAASPFSGGAGMQVNDENHHNPTARYSPSPKGDSGTRVGMNASIDWVLSFDFKQWPSGLTTQNESSDKIFELGAASGGDIMVVTSSPGGASLGSGDGTTAIGAEFLEGNLTLHYKASNERMDLWRDNVLVATDFTSIGGNYDVDFMQIAGGSVSNEVILIDNLILGVIPEPATGLLLFAGGLALLRRRR